MGIWARKATRHTPGWLSEKGTGHSHFHSDISTRKPTEEQEAKNAELRGLTAVTSGPCGPSPGMQLEDPEFGAADSSMRNQHAHINPIGKGYIPWMDGGAANDLPELIAPGEACLNHQQRGETIQADRRTKRC